MANQEHLAILRRGVKTWNQWRQDHPEIQPDLFGADITDSEAAYEGETTVRRNFQRINFQGVNLNEAILGGADFPEADFSKSRLIHTNLSMSNLDWVKLNGSDLRYANLSMTGLQEADLTDALLGWTVFQRTRLSGTIFNKAKLVATIFSDVDLSQVKGLETVQHISPLTIGIDTIINSQGKIPEIFLRRAGFPDSIIEAIPSLIGSLSPIDYYSCFISYSSKDEAFATRLYADLQSNHVRCWFAPEDMDIGDKIRPRIEESIRIYDKLLLVLSEYSIASNWVAYEVERALNKEPEGIPNVLYPVRLDNTVMQSKAGWAEDIRRTRHIGDFTNWKNHDDYEKAFTRLLRALKAKVQKI